MADVEFTDHSDEVESLIRGAVERVLTRWGSQAESYAKKKCPVDTGRLRNSITYRTDTSNGVVYIGSNVEYCPYQELGTGTYYYGFQMGYGIKPKRFLTSAVMDHTDFYSRVLQSEMKDLANR